MGAHLQPGFWCEYSPPCSHVATLVQAPAYQIDAYSLSDAYMRDARAGRQALDQDTPTSISKRKEGE